MRASKETVLLAKAALPAELDSFSRQMMRRGPALTDAEFLGMLVQLRDRHLDPEAVDKRRYSYYSYELGESRHRVVQLLGTTDWTARVEALAGFLAGGERLYLVGEDLGLDPASGVTTTPGREPRILEALQRLAQGREARVWTLPGKPHLRIIQVGKGMLVLDRRSPDGAGNSNLHLAAFQKAWREEMERTGLTPGGIGTTFLPMDEEPLAAWMSGK